MSWQVQKAHCCIILCNASVFSLHASWRKDSQLATPGYQTSSSSWTWPLQVCVVQFTRKHTFTV